MSKYATGKYAYGISDRSGFRYRLRDMRKEWNGLLVGKDEFEPKHPQLEPLRAVPDAQALRNPRPDPVAGAVSVSVGDNIFPTPKNTMNTIGYVGVVSVIGVDVDVNVTPTGVSATGSVGTVSVTAASAPTFDSTSITLDSTSETFDEG